MKNTVKIFLFEKPYDVPSDLTVMTAMEYVGHRLIKGSGCRNGICGACATVYRIGKEGALKTGLACQTKVQNNMYVATFASFPLEKRVYDIEAVSAEATVLRQLYPEISSCIGCNLCNKTCPQGLNVKQYIEHARRGEFQQCAELSFACVMCGLCSAHCPVGILHPQVALLARRIYGKYVAPTCEHLNECLEEGRRSELAAMLEALTDQPIEQLQELYRHREIEE